MSSQLTVYKASAGSGKTFTLAREYMTLVIANPASYRTILAVTFTNKATEEMKMRILGKLYEIAHGLPEANDYVNQIQQALPYLSSKQIQKNAESALHLLIHNYNYFRVMTIDTFFQSVLRNLARELDLTANLRIELNDYQIEQHAVDELIESLEDTDRLLFWIMDYIKENIDDDKSWNVIGQIKKFGENIFKDYYKAHSDYPLVSDEAFRLDASQAVCTLVNALYILVHPNDNIALATLNKFCDTYSVAGNMPEQLLTNRSEYLEMPLFDLTERLFAELKLGEIKDMIKQTAYICTFYDCLSKYLTDNSSDITGFLKEWDNRIHEKSIHSDGDGGIRFLTIHKSKGLEYDHVIMPYCDWQLEKANTIWCTPQEAPYNELPLVPIDFSAKLMKQSIYEADYNHEHLQNIVDNLNLLYVAFTRASHNLIVIGKRANSAYRSAIIESVLDKVASRLEANDVKMELTGIGSDAKTDDISFCYNEIYVPDSSKKSNEKKNTNVLSAYSQPLEIKINVTPEMPEFRQSNQSRDFIKRDETEEQQKFYIKMGTILHNLFSTIRTVDDIDGALKQLELDGLLYDQDLTPEKIKEMIRKRLESPKVAKWFDKELTILNECSILTVENGKVAEYRPDRVMQNSRKETIVVDFKFGKQKVEHHEQVRKYIGLLKSMGHHRVKGYLWYVYPNRIVEVIK